jgi:hypothetical protein
MYTTTIHYAGLRRLELQSVMDVPDRLSDR